MFDSFTVKRNTHTSCAMTRPVSKVCHFAYENDYFRGIKFQETGEVDFCNKNTKTRWCSYKVRMWACAEVGTERVNVLVTY